MTTRNTRLRIVTEADFDAAIERLLTRWREQWHGAPPPVPEPSDHLLGQCLVWTHGDEDAAWNALQNIPL